MSDIKQNNETEQIKILLQFSDDDFEVWETKEYGSTYYNIGVEGYIGFDDFKSFISLYKEFLINLESYLTKQKYKKTEKHIWKCLHQTRAIEICHECNSYWIFLEPYKSTQIWDIYYYMEDVIRQLEEFDIQNRRDIKNKDDGYSSDMFFVNAMRDKQFIDFEYEENEIEEMPEDIKPMAKIREIVQRAREAKGDWKRMAEIAQSELEKNGQTIEDVHNYLNEIRTPTNNTLSKWLNFYMGCDVEKMMCGDQQEIQKHKEHIENRNKFEREKMLDDETVQYFIVNSELNMSAGKVSAQVAHVANKIKLDADTVIILKAKEKDLLKLIEHGFYYTRDLGRTEVQSGSLTCVGLPPMKKSEAQKYVKRFRLL